MPHPLYKIHGNTVMYQHKVQSHKLLALLQISYINIITHTSCFFSQNGKNDKKQLTTTLP